MGCGARKSYTHTHVHTSTTRKLLTKKKKKKSDLCYWLNSLRSDDLESNNVFMNEVRTGGVITPWFFK